MYGICSLLSISRSINKFEEKVNTFQIRIKFAALIFTNFKFVTNLTSYGSRYLSRYSDSLRTRRFGDGFPVRARVSAPFHTGSGAHPASCTRGMGSPAMVKRTELGVDHPLYLESRLRRSRSKIYSPSRPSWPILG
jgi:hypothetical protein